MTNILMIIVTLFFTVWGSIQKDIPEHIRRLYIILTILDVIGLGILLVNSLFE